MNTDLTKPLKFISGHEMKNRFGLAPLTNHQSEENGEASPEDITWLGMRADGGFGLVMTCAAHVAQRGQGFPRQLGVFDDSLLPGLREISARLADTFSVVQLHHAGIRSPKEVIGEQPVGPSDHEKTGSRAMTLEEVKQAVKDFIDGAVRAEKAGFDGVEIHGAHGYLLTQFMSQEHNFREDEYGGSYENRTRMLREVIDGVKKACSDGFSVGVRLSPEGNGMPLKEVTKLSQELIDRGDLDYLDISLWDCFKEPVEEEHQGRTLLSYFTDLQWNNVKLVVAGKLRTPQDVEAMMEQGVDFICLGRAAILQHDFPLRYMENPRFEPVHEPVSSDYLKQQGLSDSFIEYMSSWDGFVK